MIKGKPLPLVEKIAPPSQQELDALIARWNDNAPVYYRGLLEAQLVGTPNPTSKFLYSKATMTYIDRATGRKLTRAEVKQAYMAFVETMSRKP